MGLIFVLYYTYYIKANQPNHPTKSRKGKSPQPYPGVIKLLILGESNVWGGGTICMGVTICMGGTFDPESQADHGTNSPLELFMKSIP